ncbi:MAG: hypothetical protein JW743_05000 [Deltaproteobacteria bacterium]|nr:hypothetical protein [Deltaproteobacteria bacterium]
MTFGIVVGLSAGLLVDSCLVVLAYPLIIFIFPILLIPPIVGIVFGLRLANAGMVPQWPWSVLVLTGIFSMTLATLTPYALSVVELRWQGHDIPVLPNALLLETHTGPLGSSMAGPSITKIMDTGNSGVDVVSFYWNELKRNSWMEVSIREDGAWFTKMGRHIFIDMSKNQARTRVKVTYNLASVKAPIVVLLAAFVSYLYVWHRYRNQSQK